jgi:UDP-N-acetylglucosamine 2-epimerase (non-hydrolysing)
MIYVPIGTKAQLIKMAPILRELDQQNADYQFILTGQHQETMTELYQAFSLREPDGYFMKPVEANSVSRLLSWLIKSSWNALFVLTKNKEKNIVLVHGDTLSTLQSALIGKIKGMTIIHVEAGLRSNSLLNPFPEEITRRIVSQLADYFIVQDSDAEKNLSHKSKNRILNTHANTMMDALNYAREKINSKSPEQPYAIASLHRSENLSNEERFNCLMQTVIEASEKLTVKFILHPVTKKKLEHSKWRQKLLDAGVLLLDRMDYIQFTELMLNAEFLITDGGSNQEEASYIGLPCLIMREYTERSEGLNQNAVLAKFNPKLIKSFLESPNRFRKEPRYKTENVSQQIVGFIQNL